jgi:hypothetical protein
MGNYAIAVRNYVIVSPSELGNYKIADSPRRSRKPEVASPLLSLRRDQLPEPALEYGLVVNGQVEVPAGGHLKVPVPRG